MTDEPRTQFDALEEAARELETDDGPARFEERVGKHVMHKPIEKAVMIRGILYSVLMIALGSYALIHRHPDAWFPDVGAALILAGLLMLAIAIIARFRPGLQTTSAKEKGRRIAPPAP